MSIDTQTLLAQIAELRARLNGLEGRSNSQVIGTDVANPQVNFTATSLSTLSADYTGASGVQANDPSNGTIYRLQAWGDFTIPAATPQTFQWGISAFGVNPNSGTCSVTLGGGYQTGSMLSQTMEWGLTVVMNIKVAGSSGTLNTFMWGSIGQFGTNLGQALAPGPQSNSLALAGGASDVSVDTTVQHGIALTGKFGAAVTSPQAVRYFGSILERLGP